MRKIWFLSALWSAGILAQVWLPTERTPGEIVPHLAYTVSYSEYDEGPNWVAYALRPEHLKDCVSRSDQFAIDPLVSTGTANPTDYARTGYDRGHLAPAGDMKWSKVAMKESFYMSNITPQSPGLNRGRWVALENLVRAWAKKSDELIIVAGPVLQGPILGRLGSSRVNIAEQFFKVLLKVKNGKRSAIGFLFTQTSAGQDISTYALPVRAIEDLTGLDFFPHLSASAQDELERNLDLTNWDFRATFAYSVCN